MSAFDLYRSEIEKMQLGNRKSVLTYVNTTLQSTNLMTRLRCGTQHPELGTAIKDPYDVLIARFFSRKYYLATDLVIIYDIPKKELQQLLQESDPDENNNMTFTELKKKRLYYWSAISENRGVCDIPFNGVQVLNLWSYPFFLNAVTDFDKDFRKEWRDGFLEYEGNNYGDTSTFYIIGTLENRNET